MPIGKTKTWRQALIMATTAALLAQVFGACIEGDNTVGGFIGTVEGESFDVVSGRAEHFGTGLEIVLSDAPGDDCFGTGSVEPVGNRKVILSTDAARADRFETAGGGQISIQIKSAGDVFSSRTATGSFTLETLELNEDGEVAGSIEATSAEGDDLKGSFFVTFCP